MLFSIFRRTLLGLGRFSRTALASSRTHPSTFFCAAPYFLPVLIPRCCNRLLSTLPPQFQQLGQTSPSLALPLSSPSRIPPVPLSTTNILPEHLALLPLLKLQPSHYITIHVNGFPFLVTPGDLLTLPFLLKDVQIGDILRLTHASVLGSRDFTIKGAPYIDEDLFELRATVVEFTSEPMRVKEKTKRRQRKVKSVKSKHPYTVLRIGELILKDLVEI